MASGIAVPTSTTARRSGRRRTTNAASIRSRRPGRSCPAPRRRSAPRAPWRRSTSSWFAARTDCLLFAPPFDQTPHDPGYIKGYVPGVRENGGQYTHAAMWTVLAFAALGDGDKAAELFSIAQSDQPSANPRRRVRYKVEPYVVCARRLLDSRRTSGAEAGPGTRARQAGCIARGSRAFSGCDFGERSFPSIPASQTWGKVRGHGEISNLAISSFVENPNGVNRGVVFA